MSCAKLHTPAPLPPITGVSLPDLVIPAFSGGVDLCCQFNVAAFVNLPSTPPIPFLGAALAVIDADIATLDVYIAALDLISLNCPIE